jgi:hypothetical protein
MAASLRGREPGNRGTPTVGSSTVKTVTENTSLRVTVSCEV